MQIIIGIFSFIFGTIIASFCGVVGYRVPNKMSIVRPASHCSNCNYELKWYDNIPLISYVILRGKCRKCHTKIGIFSFLLELIGGLGYLALFLIFGFSYQFFIGLALGFIFLVIAAIDYYSHYVYDFSLIIFSVIAVCFVLCDSIINKIIPYSNFIGLAVGFVVFYLIRFFSKKVYKVEALGLGDVFLVGIAGLLLGVFNLVFAILVASVLGMIIEGGLILFKKKNRECELAFGPYLVLGFFTAYLFGNLLLNLLV